MHPVMALALGVPVNRLRLEDAARFRWQSSGRSTRSSLTSSLMALAARKSGRPVKWVETRLEHLVAATSATNR